MKYVSVIFVLILFSCSKPTKEELAHTAIKEYIKGKMNDPSSYQSVSFGKLDTVFTPFISHIKTDLPFVLDTFRTDSREGIALQNSRQSSRDSLTKLLETERKNFKPRMEFFTMEHSFRGKNALGALILNNIQFQFDTTMKVVGGKDIE